MRDIRNEARDQEIARHVLRVHINASTETAESAEESEWSAEGSVGGSAGS